MDNTLIYVLAFCIVALFIDVTILERKIIKHVEKMHKPPRRDSKGKYAKKEK